MSVQNSPRLLVPRAIVQILTTLIDAESVASHERVTLRTIRSQMCRLYRLSDPQAPTNTVALAQLVEDPDGESF